MATSLAVLRERYPHIADAITPVANLIRLMEKQKHPELCELEARIGVSVPIHERGEGGVGSKFIAGVDKSFLARVLCSLETTNCWSTVKNWTQQVDRFYLLPSGLQVRTTNESVGSLNEPESAACVTTHMIKTDIAQHTFFWEQTPASESTIHTADDGTLYDIRVSLKKEEPVLEDELQDRVDNISTVRLKQRKTFTYSSATRPGLQWNTDVTQLYQASSFVETVEKLKLGIVTSYELEVECQNPMEHLKLLGFDHERLAASLLLKAADAFEIRREGLPSASLEDTDNRLCLRS
jgi:hypothetical protein